MTALETLSAILAERGSIPTVRVSSAQARGRAKLYSYWGAVRYRLRLARDGAPIHVACERASSDRRSLRLAHSDASALAASEGRIECQTLGHLSEQDAADVLAALHRAPDNQ